MSWRYSIATLGCKVNQADSAIIAADLEAAGYCPVPFGEKADLIVVNTCAVTARADRDGRNLVARAKAACPEAVVLVTGCSPNISEPAAIYSDASIVCGNMEKADIALLVAEHRRTGRRIEQIDPIQNARAMADVCPKPMRGRTRAFCKIQDGCSFSCAYCIVPHARGPSRSLFFDQARDHYRALVDAGFAEIVLIGIHLGAWGRDLNPPVPFSHLVDRLAAEFPETRLRLSSIEPMEVDDDLIGLFARRPNLCPHIHIPLQSGADEILRAMNRNYNAETFAGIVHRLAQADWAMTIGADVIVGFPGETDDHFNQTRELVDRLPLAHLHVFAYSKRPHTRAAKMPGQVSPEIIRERSALLRDLGMEKRKAHYRRFIGQTLEVLSEGAKADGRYGGMTGNYIPVRFETPAPEGTAVKVALTREIRAGRLPGLFGMVVEKKGEG